MVWINIVVVAVPSIVLLVARAKRPSRDLGQVSRQWMAQHVAD